MNFRATLHSMLLRAERKRDRDLVGRSGSRNRRVTRTTQESD